MGAKEDLKKFKAEIDIELEKYFETKIKEASELSSYTKELIKHIADLSMRGGKRIRPALTYYSYLACGGKNRREILNASMAIELSETYLLIHDDVMDDDCFRRGGTTIHENYRQYAEEVGNHSVNVKNFGTAMGINAGDMACAMSNEILSNIRFNPKSILKAVAEFNNVYIKEIYGQSLDVISQLRDDLTPQDVILIHQYKTVPYTFDGPIKIGAILAGANSKMLDALSKYTVPLGTAFQIQDDILGMFGSEEKTGKSVVSDLREGKKTLLILNALEKADKLQKEIIDVNLGNKRASTAGLKAVRKIIEETGSLEESKKLAEKLVNDSISALEKIPLKKEGKDFLLGIADFMIKREY